MASDAPQPEQARVASGKKSAHAPHATPTSWAITSIVSSNPKSANQVRSGLVASVGHVVGRRQFEGQWFERRSAKARDLHRRQIAREPTPTSTHWIRIARHSGYEPRPRAGKAQGLREFQSTTPRLAACRLTPEPPAPDTPCPPPSGRTRTGALRLSPRMRPHQPLRPELRQHFGKRAVRRRDRPDNPESPHRERRMFSRNMSPRKANPPPPKLANNPWRPRTIVRVQPPGVPCSSRVAARTHLRLADTRSRLDRLRLPRANNPLANRRARRFAAEKGTYPAARRRSLDLRCKGRTSRLRAPHIVHGRDHR